MHGLDLGPELNKVPPASATNKGCVLTRKIIIYNSFAHDTNPHATLLKRQLDEVNRELLGVKTRDHKHTLLNERKLLQRKLRSIDNVGHDGVGSIEEQAFGEGWHSESNTNPYTDPIHKAAWEKGRAAGRLKRKMSTNAHKGGVRGQRFDPPKVRVSADGSWTSFKDWNDEYTLLLRKRNAAERAWRSERDPSKQARLKSKFDEAHARTEAHRSDPNRPSSTATFNFNRPRDYKSEKGFVAKLIDAQTGNVLARSEPHISNGLGLKKWIQEEAAKLIKRGKRVKAEVAVVFFDPNMA